MTFGSTLAPVVGGTGGKADSFSLGPDEWVDRITMNEYYEAVGDYTYLNGCPVLLYFHTSKGNVYGPYGEAIGGSRVGEFHESPGHQLVALSVKKRSTDTFFKELTPLFNSC